MADYTFIQVKGVRDLNRWLDFTNQLYPTSLLFIPPIRQNLVRLFEKKTPYQTSDIQADFYMVVNGRNKVVARTVSHRSLKFNQKMSSGIQLFGFTEFVDDFAVFRFLFSELKRKAAQAGCRMLLGPANLLPNQFGGVLTSGFDRRGFADNVYNHAYYPKFYIDFGFQKIFESQTFICEQLTSPGIDPAAMFPFDDQRILGEDLEIHTGRKSAFRKEQIPVLLNMLNESFSALKYYTPISQEELLYQTEGLEFIMENKLFVYLTKNSRPIGFILCVPDLAEFLCSIQGNLNTVNLVRLLLARSRYKTEAVLIIKGVVPGETGKGYMSLLNRELLKNCRKLGYQTIRSTWVETDNKASAAHFLKMNGKVLQDITFYKMSL